MTSWVKIVFLWSFLVTITYALNTVLNVEELNSIHYAVDILNKPVLKEKAWEGEAMTVFNNHGQEYVCTLPNVAGLYSESRKDDNIFDQLVDISVLLKPMETAPCLIKTVDWWTYEFCYSSVIKQYHLEDNKASGAILILGKYESEYNWRNSSETKNRLQRFHSQFYVNGTKCDLTQEPRRTEVRFQCEDGVGDYIQRVDEPESCRYIVTIATTRVCHHPYLRMQGTTNPNAITCSPALTQEQYDKYLRYQELKRKEEASSRARWLKNAEILSDVEGLDGKSITDIKQDNSGTDYDDLKMNIKIFRLNPNKNILSLPAQDRREEVAIETQITLQEMNQGGSHVVSIVKILDSTGPAYNKDSGPEKVIDGDLRSYWNVDILNGRYHNNWFITFELKRRYTVVGTKLRSYGDTTHDVTKFKLESSDDKVNWHMGGSTSDVTAGSSKWQNFNGFKATGKYLRFTITETQSGWQPWLSEISFTGYPSDLSHLNVDTSEDAQNIKMHDVDVENGTPEVSTGNSAQMKLENKDKDKDSWNILEEDDDDDDDDEDDDENIDVDEDDNNDTDTDDSKTDKEVHLEKAATHKKQDKSQDMLQDESKEQIISAAALDDESLAELQKMVESINKGRIKQLEDEVEEWTNKLLDKNTFLDLDETEIEEEEQRMGSALSSLMDALDNAEDKLSKARADMETLEEFLDGQLQEMELEDSTSHPPSQEPTDTLDTPTPSYPQDQGPTEGDPTQDHTTDGSKKETKKISDKNWASLMSGHVLKSSTEEESHKNQLEEKIKDKLQKLGLEKIENTNEKSPHLRQKLLELKSKVKEIGYQKKNNDIEKSIYEKLVNPIQEKLEKRGILSEGRKFEVKILTPNALEDDDKNSLSSMSQEETEAFQNMIVNLLSANAEEIEERENHRKLESNYAFNWDDDVKLPEEEDSKSE